MAPTPTQRRQQREKALGPRGQLSRRDYQQRGYASLERDPGQTEMFPRGSLPDESTHNPRIKTWEEMAPEERKATQQRLSAKYGVTLQSAVKEHGHLLDNAFMRAQHECSKKGNCGDQIHAEGQNWYHGGEGSEARAVGTFARAHGIPFQTSAAMRAVVSPQTNAYEELTGAGAAIRHVQASPEQPYAHGARPGEPAHIRGGGKILQQNLQKAAEIYRGHLLGQHPHEVEVESTGRGERGQLPALHPSGPMKGQPKILPALSGGKVIGYESSYSNPYDPRRLAIDRHAVAGMAQHLTPKEHMDLIEEPGAHAFFTHAITQAAKKRGLGAAEGQTVGWHEWRNYASEGIGVHEGHMPSEIAERFPDAMAPPRFKPGGRTTGGHAGGRSLTVRTSNFGQVTKRGQPVAPRERREQVPPEKRRKPQQGSLF